MGRVKWNDIEVTATDPIVRNHWILPERILSHTMVEYLASKNRQYYYNTIPVETLVITRQVDDNPVEIANAWKVSVLGVILVRIFPHSDYEFGKTRTSITPNMNTFYVVYSLHKTEPYPFQTLEKSFLQRISREIIPVVYNLISKFLLVKLLLIMERMMQIWKTLLRSLIKLNRHLFPCSLEVPLGRFMSSKLQEKAKKTFLIHTNTLSCRYAVFPNKDSNQSSSLKKCSNPPGL